MKKFSLANLEETHDTYLYDMGSILNFFIIIIPALSLEEGIRLLGVWVYSSYRKFHNGMMDLYRRSRYLSFTYVRRFFINLRWIREGEEAKVSNYFSDFSRPQFYTPLYATYIVLLSMIECVKKFLKLLNSKKKSDSVNELIRYFNEVLNVLNNSATRMSLFVSKADIIIQQCSSYLKMEAGSKKEELRVDIEQNERELYQLLKDCTGGKIDRTPITEKNLYM